MLVCRLWHPPQLTAGNLVVLYFDLGNNIRRNGVTIISGCDVSDEDAEKVTEIVKAKCPNHVEVSHIRGGQPVYYYMISVE